MKPSAGILIFVIFKLSVLIIGSQKLRTVGTSGRFPVYWNIPSVQCHKYKLDFPGLAKKYNILQNNLDSFNGNVITILYDPGAFPAILSSDTSKLRNGGVPQEGNLTLHLDLFRKAIEVAIPDKKFAGLGVIDMESWRPVFRQNYASLLKYKTYSKEVEKKLHPKWTSAQIEKEAINRFELYARKFMEESILFAQKLRPYATWGYYIFPLCFNMSNASWTTECPVDKVQDNNNIAWLYEAEDNLHPSLYFQQNNLNPKERMQLIIGRVHESQRIIRYINKTRSVIPYFMCKYQDTGSFLTWEDIYNSFHTLKNLTVDGLVIWGSSSHVNSQARCNEVYKYFDTVVGPILNTL